MKNTPKNHPNQQSFCRKTYTYPSDHSGMNFPPPEYLYQQNNLINQLVKNIEETQPCLNNEAQFQNIKTLNHKNMKTKEQLKQSLKSDLKNPTNKELNVMSAILLQFAKIEHEAHLKKMRSMDAVNPIPLHDISSQEGGIKTAA